MLNHFFGLVVVLFMSVSFGESVVWVVLMSGVFLMSSWDIGFKVVSSVFEVDSVSWCMVLLSCWIISLCMLSSSKQSSLKELVFVEAGLLVTLCFSFSVSDYMCFYVGFECCVIPILLLIMGWGYQMERLYASVYLLFYTLFGSLPLFLLLMTLSVYNGSSSLTADACFFLSAPVFMCLVGAFLVKFPVYGLHLWLLKAHVEAPAQGSMVLAGVLLKLGGYGLIRVFSMCEAVSASLMSLLYSFSLWGAMMISLSCMRQTDIKMLIAMSSVVHMGLCIGGLFSVNYLGLKGTVILMVGHGLCSSGLFYMAGLVYNSYNSRSLLVSKGMMNLYPSMSLFWFMLLSSNMAAPPSWNLMGEVILLSSVFSYNLWSVVVVGVLSFFSAAYSLYLFSLSQHGAISGLVGGHKFNSCMDYLTVLAHWIPLNILFVCSFGVV